MEHKFIERFFSPFSRFTVFAIYSWFGTLKLLGLSPAGELVHHLFDRTIHFIRFDTFYSLFAGFEVLIGILFLFPKLTKVATTLFFLHMVTTLMPLILLPAEIWQQPFVPTLEGQYIIKNLALMATVLGILLWHNKQSANA